MAPIISLFNHKGGVSKTTTAFNLGWAMAESGKRILIVDGDPQCNLTIFSLPEEEIYEIWVREDNYIEDFDNARKWFERRVEKGGWDEEVFYAMYSIGEAMAW